MATINLQNLPRECLPDALLWSNRIFVPNSAFADPNNPTTAEITTYITTYFPDAAPGTLVIQVGQGGSSAPDNVWKLEDTINDMEQIESASGSDHPHAIIDVKKVTEMQVGGETSFSPNQTITNYLWRYRINGSLVGTISGAGGVDASGETAVLRGTYDNPTWATRPSEGDAVQFSLIVTDDNGDVSLETFVNFTYSEVTY